MSHNLSAIVPQRSDRLCRLFGWYVQRYVRKNFHALRVSRETRPIVPPQLPLIFVMNHPSWWDPLIGVVLARLFPNRAHFAPMEAEALGRYSLFDKLGFYSVEQGTTRGGIAFLRTTLAILSLPNSAVWIAAQGAFTDARLRPAQLRPGVGHVIARMRKVVVVPLALEYTFWNERLPEALARFGAPMLIESGTHMSARRWVDRIGISLESAQDALQADALSRNPLLFETLLEGKVAIGGIYDLGRRLSARLHHARFQAEHSG
jgi:1-acyl-sn-glycerol-3-phosphate acyltransferase